MEREVGGAFVVQRKAVRSPTARDRKQNTMTHTPHLLSATVERLAPVWGKVKALMVS